MISTNDVVSNPLSVSGMLLTLTVSMAVGAVFKPMFVALRGIASARVLTAKNAVGNFFAPVPVKRVLRGLG